MPIFNSGLPEIEILRTEVSPDHLRNFFRARIREWRHPLVSGECFTIGVFDDLIAAITPETAFALIPAAIAIAREWSGSDIQITAISLVEDLARRSGTTQMPVGLLELLHDINTAQPTGTRDATIGIQRWYRCGDQ